MSRITGPKTRFARRLGEPLREKDSKYLVKRNYRPGMHGQSRLRISEYGIQLLEKQKAKWIYGVKERQFKHYIEDATKKKGMTGDMLLRALELRLDNVIYRLGFAVSRDQARQLVNHRFFTVNGKCVNIPSCSVPVGAQIAVAGKKQSSTYIQQILPRLKSFKTIEWLALDSKSLSGKVLSVPTFENTGSTIRAELIIEHYSR